jgi:hypothetical protein
MPTQRRASLVDNLGGEVQRRAEPNFAWKSACSAHEAMFGLRGFWPMSAFDANGNALDQSGNGRTLTLTRNSNPYRLYDLAPAINLDGVADRLTRATEAGLNITGTELYVDAAYRGLTIGGWFWWDSSVPANRWLIGKSNGAAAGEPYRLRTTGANVIGFEVGFGGVTFTVNHTTAPTANAWHHVVGRYHAQTQDLDIVLDGVVVTNAAGGPASIVSAVDTFAIGCNGAASVFFDGRASMCFLCASSTSRTAIRSLFEQTRAMYGV